MLVIGLTGGIGSGKTTVANLFAQHHVPIIDADIIAREVTQINSPALAEIIRHFKDNNLLQTDGSLDRSKLRKIIFDQPEQRRWLEHLLHPIILAEIEKRLQTLSAPYCIIVIPLLFEVEPYPFINRILVVDAPSTLQIDRVIQRDNLSPQHVEAILQSQVTREHRLMHADDIITNSGSMQDLESQVAQLHAFYSGHLE